MKPFGEIATRLTVHNYHRNNLWILIKYLLSNEATTIKIFILGGTGFIMESFIFLLSYRFRPPGYKPSHEKGISKYPLGKN